MRILNLVLLEILTLNLINRCVWIFRNEIVFTLLSLQNCIQYKLCNHTQIFIRKIKVFQFQMTDQKKLIKGNHSMCVSIMFICSELFFH